MCDEFEDENSSNEITWTSSSKSAGVTSYVTRSISGEEAYPNIVQEFVYFLNAIGYNYIGGLAVLDDEGMELHRTDI